MQLTPSVLAKFSAYDAVLVTNAMSMCADLLVDVSEDRADVILTDCLRSLTEESNLQRKKKDKKKDKEDQKKDEEDQNEDEEDQNEDEEDQNEDEDDNEDVDDKEDEDDKEENEEDEDEKAKHKQQLDAIISKLKDKFNSYSTDAAALFTEKNSETLAAFVNSSSEAQAAFDEVEARFQSCASNINDYLNKEFSFEQIKSITNGYEKIYNKECSSILSMNDKISLNVFHPYLNSQVVGTYMPAECKTMAEDLDKAAKNIKRDVIDEYYGNMKQTHCTDDEFIGQDIINQFNGKVNAVKSAESFKKFVEHNNFISQANYDINKLVEKITLELNNRSKAVAFLESILPLFESNLFNVDHADLSVNTEYRFNLPAADLVDSDESVLEKEEGKQSINEEITNYVATHEETLKILTKILKQTHETHSDADHDDFKANIDMINSHEKSLTESYGLVMKNVKNILETRFIEKFEKLSTYVNKSSALSLAVTNLGNSVDTVDRFRADVITPFSRFGASVRDMTELHYKDGADAINAKDDAWKNENEAAMEKVEVLLRRHARYAQMKQLLASFSEIHAADVMPQGYTSVIQKLFDEKLKGIQTKFDKAKVLDDATGDKPAEEEENHEDDKPAEEEENHEDDKPAEEENHEDDKPAEEENHEDDNLKMILMEGEENGDDDKPAEEETHEEETEEEKNKKETEARRQEQQIAKDALLNDDALMQTRLALLTAFDGLIDALEGDADKDSKSDRIFFLYNAYLGALNTASLFKVVDIESEKIGISVVKELKKVLEVEESMKKTKDEILGACTDYTTWVDANPGASMKDSINKAFEFCKHVSHDQLVATIENTKKMNLMTASLYEVLLNSSASIVDNAEEKDNSGSTDNNDSQNNESKKEESNSLPWIIGGCVVGGLAVGAGAYYFTQKKKKTAEEEELLASRI